MGKMRNGQAEHLTLVKPNRLQESDGNSTPQSETIAVTVHFASEFIDQSKHIYNNNVDRDIIFKSLSS